MISHQVLMSCISLPSKQWLLWNFYKWSMLFQLQVGLPPIVLDKIYNKKPRNFSSVQKAYRLLMPLAITWPSSNNKGARKDFDLKNWEKYTLSITKWIELEWNTEILKFLEYKIIKLTIILITCPEMWWFVLVV